MYNEERISEFWKARPGELLTRWTRFTAIAAPWLTKFANAWITGTVEQRQAELARDAVTNMCVHRKQGMLTPMPANTCCLCVAGSNWAQRL